MGEVTEFLENNRLEVIRSLGGTYNRELIEDAIQDVVAKDLRKPCIPVRGTIKDIGAWSYLCVHNRIKDILRKRDNKTLLYEDTLHSSLASVTSSRENREVDADQYLNLITDDRQRECVIAYFMYPDTREKIKEKYNIKNTTIKYHAEQGIKRIQLKLTANSC